MSGFTQYAAHLRDAEFMEVAGVVAAARGVANREIWLMCSGVREVTWIDIDAMVEARENVMRLSTLQDLPRDTMRPADLPWPYMLYLYGQRDADGGVQRRLPRHIPAVARVGERGAAYLHDWQMCVLLRALSRAVWRYSIRRDDAEKMSIYDIKALHEAAYIRREAEREAAAVPQMVCALGVGGGVVDDAG